MEPQIPPWPGVIEGVDDEASVLLAAPGSANKTRRSRYPASECEKYRAVLPDLYMDKDKSLPETMRFMSYSRGFDPRLVMMHSILETGSWKV